MSHPTWNRIGQLGLLPVITLPDAAQAAPLAHALAEGGLPLAEVTLRTPAALEGIAAMRAARPDVLVGAGTVLDAAQAREAVAAGAQFIVAPGLSADMVREAQNLGVPVIPGICTPSELTAALALGLETVKFFPAQAYGGVATLKALSAPFNQVNFIPTGGIDLARLPEYLTLPQVIAAGGSWMVPVAALAAGDFDRIRELTREAAQAVYDIRAART